MQAFLSQTPVWVVVFTLGVLVAFGALALAMLWDLVAARPFKTYNFGGTTVELWVRERKFPVSADAVVVPVAPDLKMVAGAAKVVRDATGDIAQVEADRAAPLEPGQAFTASGGRFRFRNAILAVVMDGQKRVSEAVLVAGVRAGLEKARAASAYSVMIPDMTEDLIHQPEEMPVERRREVCRSVAGAVVDAVVGCGPSVGLVRIWVWRKGMETIWLQELDRWAEPIAIPDAAPSAA